MTGDTGAIMHSQATVVMDQPTTDGGGGDNIQSRVASQGGGGGVGVYVVWCYLCACQTYFIRKVSEDRDRKKEGFF